MLALMLVAQLTVVGQLADRVERVDMVTNYPEEGWPCCKTPWNPEWEPDHFAIAWMDGAPWRCTETAWPFPPDVPERGWDKLYVWRDGRVYGNVLDGPTTTFRRDDTCNIVEDAPPVQVPPEVPTNVHGAEVTSTSILIAWTDNSLDEARFRVQRRDYRPQPDGSILSTWALIAWVSANETQHLWSGLNPGTEYEFRVAACASEESGIGCSRGSTPGFSTTLDEPTPPDPEPIPPPVTEVWAITDSIPQGRILAPGNFFWHVLVNGEPHSQHTTQHVAFSEAIQAWQRGIILGAPVDVRVCTDVEQDGYCYQVVKGETVIIP